MAAIELKKLYTENIEFVNRTSQGESMNLKNQYSYNVKYSGNGSLCRGEFTATVRDTAAPENFSAVLTVVGIFSYDPSLSRDAIHRQTYREMFPHVRAMMITVTAAAGIPPLLLPSVDIDGQDVYSIDLQGRP